MCRVLGLYMCVWCCGGTCVCGAGVVHVCVVLGLYMCVWCWGGTCV